MSDSSLKSEGYSSLILDASVPSTPVCCFIISVILKSYNGITGIYGTIFSFIFFVLFVITLLMTASRYKIILNNKKLLLFSTTTVLITCCSIYLYLNKKIDYLISDNQLPDSIKNISVVVEDISLKRYSSEIYFHSLDNSCGSLKGIIYYHGELNFTEGDHIFLHKHIKKINVNDKNQFNNYLISRGIHYTSGFTDSDITIIKKNDIPIRSYLKNYLMDRINILFENPGAGLIKALLSGNSNYIEKKIIIEFRNSGVLHCLSASGLHVAIFAAIPAFLLMPFVRKNIAVFASLLMVTFYLFITDMPVSLQRAVIMFGLFYLQSILFRKRNVLNYLMLTCSIILVASPWEIFNPGFQLSFSATGGILIFYKQYRQSLKNLPGLIADTTAVTLSAQLLTLPIVQFHMNQINTAGIAANIIIIPIITLIMGASLFTILLSFTSVTAAVFSGKITGLLIKFSLIITNIFSDLRLNFFVYDITPLLVIIILTGAIPLINYVKLKKLKFYPVIISVFLCTLYLRSNSHTTATSLLITDGNSNAEIKMENKKQILKLNLQKDAETDLILSEIKRNNPDIKIIELENSNNSTLLASKRILNDYVIDEFRFTEIPDINGLFKKTIFQLEKDNVTIKFNKKT